MHPSGRATVVGQFSSRTRKTTLEYFLNVLNPAKFESRENAEIPFKLLEKLPFRPSKYQNSAIFQDIHLNYAIHIHISGFFDIYSVFLIRKFSLIFMKIILC